MSPKAAALMWNLLLSSGLAAAIFFDQINLGYLVIAFIWFMLLIYLYVLLRLIKDPEVQSMRPQLPPHLAWPLDILNVSLMFIGGWYITMAAYVAFSLCAAQIYFRTRTSSAKNS